MWLFFLKQALSLISVGSAAFAYSAIGIQKFEEQLSVGPVLIMYITDVSVCLRERSWFVIAFGHMSTRVFFFDASFENDHT